MSTLGLDGVPADLAGQNAPRHLTFSKILGGGDRLYVKEVIRRLRSFRQKCDAAACFCSPVASQCPRRPRRALLSRQTERRMARSRGSASCPSQEPIPEHASGSPPPRILLNVPVAAQAATHTHGLQLHGPQRRRTAQLEDTARPSCRTHPPCAAPTMSSILSHSPRQAPAAGSLVACQVRSCSASLRRAACANTTA